MSSMRARSSGPTSMPPKSTYASSNSNQRGRNMPRKVTDAGIVIQIITFGNASPAAPKEPEIVLNTYQSSCPSMYSHAIKVCSPAEVRADTENAYSSRSSSHADSPAAGSENIDLYQTSHSAATASTNNTSTLSIASS